MQVIDDEKAWDWLPFPCAIPWKDMVLTISRDKFLEDPVGSVKKLIANVSEERLFQLQQLSLYHAADIDWTAHDSRVLENMLQESYNIPCRSFEMNICLSNATHLKDKNWCTTEIGTEYEEKSLYCG